MFDDLGGEFRTLPPFSCSPPKTFSTYKVHIDKHPANLGSHFRQKNFD
nr:MAG TPA: hypothetical protein [Caudoviricetes sp.]